MLDSFYAGCREQIDLTFYSQARPDQSVAADSQKARAAEPESVWHWSDIRLRNRHDACRFSTGSFDYWVPLPIRKEEWDEFHNG
jgi:hypothetical protein